GTILRQLLVLENQGATNFFGEPALDITDFIRTDRDGRGIVNILAADKLMRSPRLYATFLLWMLSELFETLPEVGDPEKPKLVSMLQTGGTPGMVARTLIAPPGSRVGPITPAERVSVQEGSPFRGKYDTAIDRESAFEVLQKRASGHAQQSGAPTTSGGAPTE